MKLGETSDRLIAEWGDLLRRVDEREVQGLEREIQRGEPIFFTGAGRSVTLLRPFAMRLMQFGFESRVVGDTTTPAVRAKSLVLVASATGRTEGVVLRAKQARRLGARVFALTSQRNSPLARVARFRLTIPAPPHGSIQMGTCWFEQAVFLLLECVVYRLAKVRKITYEQLRSRHASLE